jgi:predicted RNA-binding Zn ribbon-like protein
MEVIHSQQSDWRSKFLFVGNQLALDLLNTSLVDQNVSVELLETPADLAVWLASAGLISTAQATSLAQRWSTAQAASELADLRSFREQLRSAILATEAGHAPSPAFVTELNRWLADYPTIRQARIEDDILTATTPFTPATPRDAMRPLAAAALDAQTTIDRTRLRQCGGCAVHFLDVSKKGSRRWCSMNLCGNRHKVAAYQGRKRREMPPRPSSFAAE